MIKQQQKGFSYYEVCTSENPTYNLVFINGFAGKKKFGLLTLAREGVSLSMAKEDKNLSV